MTSTEVNKHLDVDPTDIQKYREAFRLFDVHDTGDITFAELQQVLHQFGTDASVEDITRRLAEVDVRRNGVINFDEFVKFVSAGSRDLSPEEEMNRMFRVLDPEQKGFISKQELKKILKKLGLPFTDQQIDGMLEYADTAGDGRINYNEFLQMAK